MQARARRGDGDTARAACARRPRGAAAAAAAMDVINGVREPLVDFTKESIRLLKKCTKPDRKGARAREAGDARGRRGWRGCSRARPRGRRAPRDRRSGRAGLGPDRPSPRAGTQE